MPVNAEEWDERYRGSELVWGAAPNRWVEQEVADLPPGRALDLACGEGRNALWLAARGWQVTGVDFSPVALEKARRLEEHEPPANPVTWVCADVTSYVAEEPVDLVLLCYLQVPAEQRRNAVRHAAQALDPDGVLLVVGHHTLNLVEGTGGPQDPAVLYATGDLVEDLDGLSIVVDKADGVWRDVPGADRPALDVLLRAHAE
jgi:SAM-dependent methyltransferase